MLQKIRDNLMETRLNLMNYNYLPSKFCCKYHWPETEKLEEEGGMPQSTIMGLVGLVLILGLELLLYTDYNKNPKELLEVLRPQLMILVMNGLEWKVRLKPCSNGTSTTSGPSTCRPNGAPSTSSPSTCCSNGAPSTSGSAALSCCRPTPLQPFLKRHLLLLPLLLLLQLQLYLLLQFLMALWLDNKFRLRLQLGN